MNIFIMGAPGSGKGTVSSRIKEEFNLNHISTGDIFRANIAGGTPLGLKAKEYTEKGLLVPDEITNNMVKDYLMNLADKKNGYLLDGYPRTLDQAKAFEELTKGTDLAVDRVIAMDIPFEELTRRITGRRTCKNCGEIYNIYYKPPKKENVCDVCGHELSQRKDDNEASLKVRLDEYAKNTAPVIAYYDDKGIVSHIDASKSQEEIWSTIKETLKNK
ncbi:adenylate kinase [Catenisphaera adipataccumulans]|jgi:adenylate kinase|uniref:Adenylate kinase n=1 Tax=Catenisphaera adipataccumulans TaxID=700500 RepID=A0A7W8FWQ9_9FIRM|nr:adenylate kinase [Catenisphaera adipataccumulans]MBB5183551.1 adenylate kinase [Catenisphaera adipataccumulans]